MPRKEECRFLIAKTAICADAENVRGLIGVVESSVKGIV